MTPLQITAAIVFWACIGLVGYAYAGYPLIVWACSRWFGRHAEPPAEDEDVPFVTLLIAAHNEAEVIEDTLRAALALDYPVGRLEIVIASDGSTDATAAIVRRYEKQGVRLLHFPWRRGKASVLNDAFARLTSDLVVLSDANTQIDSRAVRQMVRWFRDSRIGVVCGKLVLTDPVGGKNVDGVYWKYETFLKRCEGKLGALAGTNGGLYMIRRELFEPLPAGTLIDDFLVPLRARIRTGCAVVYDTTAVAREETPPDIRDEFRRRCRIGAGGFQSLVPLAPLMNPKAGWVSFSFLSHKVLRWFGPFFLIGALLGNALLVGKPFYAWMLAAQGAFYLLAALGAWLPARPRPLKVVRLATMFVSMNAALFVGFCRWLRNGQAAAWQRTVRMPRPVLTAGSGLAPVNR